MNGREVVGTLIPIGKVWRVGANEAPEIKFYEDATIMGKPVKAGTYALLAQANERDMTIILSSDVDQWGAYSYDQKNDVLRVNVAPQEDIRKCGEFCDSVCQRQRQRSTHAHGLGQGHGGGAYHILRHYGWYEGAVQEAKKESAEPRLRAFLFWL